MIIVLSTYPNKKSADEAALNIVREELAACVSVVAIAQSVYRWKGKVESHPEYLLLIKTTLKAYPKLELHIKQNHPHEVPEIIYIEVKGGQKDYLKWIDENTLSKLLRVPLDLKLKRSDAQQDKPRTGVIAGSG
jgi:periplasmic divalent cation tolerance protein